VDDPHGVAATPPVQDTAAAKPDLRPARSRSYLPEVTGVEFSHSRRGYDREQVDRYVEQVSRMIVELEAQRSPDAVIERALADVGEETSAILRRAREAAEEIEAEATAHAQKLTAAAEAQGCRIIDEAEAHAERARAEADAYEDQVEANVEQLADDRQRLIEDLRKLADSFQRTADRAIEEAPDRQTSQAVVGGDRAEAPEPRPA
jgi:DivIVA domain-containing protein